MAKHFSTKKALIASLISLVLCVSMLVGTTFAWFTDVATVGTNSIQAGNLDVALEMFEDGAWVSAEGKTLSFKKAAGAPADEAILWEPGCTYDLPLLRVVNKGDLALKYELIITGIDGAAKLNEAIDWTMNETKDSNTVALGTNGTLLAANETSGEILISGHMREDAGNEYQGLSITGIAITVFATQYTAESDSNGNDYDSDAEYDKFVVTNDDELTEALANATAGDIVYVQTGTYNLASVAVPAGVTVRGAKNVVFNIPQIADNKTNFMTIDADATIENLSFKATVEDTNKYGVINLKGTNITIQNCALDLTGTKYNGILVGGETADDEGTATTKIIGCNFIGGFEPISCGNGQAGQGGGTPGKILIDSCNFKNCTYSIHLNATKEDLTVKNSNLYGWITIYGRANGTDTGVVLFDNCTFNAASSAYLSLYRDVVFTNCEMASTMGLNIGKSGDDVIRITFTNTTWEGTTVLDKVTGDNDFSKDFKAIIDNVTYTYSKADKAWVMPEAVQETLVQDTETVISGTNIGATIPADAGLTVDGEDLAAGESVVLSYEPAVINGNITVEEDAKVETYEISLKTADGEKVTAAQPITVTMNIGKGREGNIRLYHNTTLVEDAKYDKDTGILTFTTTNFSPFTIVEINPATVNNQAELNETIVGAMKGDTIYLADGTYSILLKDGSTPNMAGKEITFVGSKDAVLDLTGIVGATWHTQDPDAVLVFDGLTVKWNEDNEGYQGFANAEKIVYKNCTIYGTQFMGGDAEFINCVFEAENTAEKGYAVYGRGAGTLTFTDCEFNTDGRALMLFQDQTTEVNVVMTNCTFKDNGNYSSKDKAVVETGDGSAQTSKFNITLTNCTAVGFEANGSTSNLWGNKDNIGTDRLNVIIDGVDVY